MNSLDYTFQKINDKNIPLYAFPTSEIAAASVKYNQSCSIFYNQTKFETRRELRCALEHECAHCDWDAFYSINDSLQTWKRREYKANKAMIQELVPFVVLLPLLEQQTPIWEIADIFDVTDEVIKLAIKIYKQMNLLN